MTEKCPLCNNEKYYIIKKYSIDNLKTLWNNQIGYDPFDDNYNEKVLYKRLCTKCKIHYYSPSYFGDDIFYENLSKITSFYYEEDKWEFLEAIKILNNHSYQSLLEIGCGSGTFLEKVHNSIDDCYGIDINKNAINECSKKGLNAEICKIEEIKGIFDVIVSFEVFEHLDNIEQIFHHCSQKLNKEGLFILAVPNPDGYFKDLDINILDMPPHHNMGFTRESFDYIAQKFNFEIVDYLIEPLRQVHYQYLVDNNHVKQKFFKYDHIFVFDLLNKVVEKFLKLLDLKLSTHFYFQSGKDMIGQTHLVVFKKY